MATSEAVNSGAFLDAVKSSSSMMAMAVMDDSDGHDHSHSNVFIGYISLFQHYFFNHYFADVHVHIKAAAVFRIPLGFINCYSLAFIAECGIHSIDFIAWQ